MVLVLRQAASAEDDEGDRDMITHAIGWSSSSSAQPLAKLLFQQVQSRFSPRLQMVLGTIQIASNSSHALLPDPPFLYWAGIPLIQADRLIGVLIALDRKALSFTPGQFDLLRLIALQVTSKLKPESTSCLSETPAQIPSQLQTQPNLSELSGKLFRDIHALSLWMQSCITQAELFQSIDRWIQPLLPGCSGRILLSNPLDVQMTLTAQWGEWPTSAENCLAVFCPVVQMGQSYSQCIQPQLSCHPEIAIAPSSPNLCRPAAAHFCTPLITAENAVLGTLALWHPQASGLPEPYHQIGRAIAQHLALTLQRLQRIEELQQQSIRDPLTGLFNRRYLAETLPHLLQRAERGQQPLSIILLDIDHFKQVNDRFGHAAGDQVLRDTSLFLKGFIRGTDIACRYGGEEFILILPDAPLKIASERAERIRQGLHYISMSYAGQSLGSITLSAGVATFPNHGDTPDRLIAAADQALYQSKLEGRDRVTPFIPLN